MFKYSVTEAGYMCEDVKRHVASLRVAFPWRSEELPAGDGGDASIHRYRSESTGDGKVNSTSSRGDLYESMSQPILRLLRQSPALYLLC